MRPSSYRPTSRKRRAKAPQRSVTGRIYSTTRTMPVSTMSPLRSPLASCIGELVPLARPHMLMMVGESGWGIIISRAGICIPGCCPSDLACIVPMSALQEGTCAYPGTSCCEAKSRVPVTTLASATIPRRCSLRISLKASSRRNTSPPRIMGRSGATWRRMEMSWIHC